MAAARRIAGALRTRRRAALVDGPGLD
jgi:hypothetical protein